MNNLWRWLKKKKRRILAIKSNLDKVCNFGWRYAYVLKYHLIRGILCHLYNESNKTFEVYTYTLCDHSNVIYVWGCTCLFGGSFGRFPSISLLQQLVQNLLANKQWQICFFPFVFWPWDCFNRVLTGNNDLQIWLTVSFFPSFCVLYYSIILLYSTRAKTSEIMFHLSCDEVSAFMWLAKVWDLEFKFPLLQYLLLQLHQLLQSHGWAM